MVTLVPSSLTVIFGKKKKKLKLKNWRQYRRRRDGSITASVKRRVATLCEPGFLIVNQKPLGKRGSLSYSDILRDFTMSEEQYIRELNLLTKVFRKPLIDSPHLFSEEEVDSVFCNLTDIYELTLQFWSMIEAATEMAGAGTKGVPLLGDYFEEMAEVDIRS